jgi:hypothetical protein
MKKPTLIYLLRVQLPNRLVSNRVAAFDGSVFVDAAQQPIAYSVLSAEECHDPNICREFFEAWDEAADDA